MSNTHTLLMLRLFRYLKRGSDNSGDVANFVETEQILKRKSDGQTSSFVQVRKFFLDLLNVLDVYYYCSFNDQLHHAFIIISHYMLHFFIS